MNIFRIFVTFFLLSVPILLLANNIAIANTTLTGNNKTDKYVQVKFDISWDNSWRTSSAPNNWDAAWVFVKYKERASGLWKHAKLHNTGHVAPDGATVTPGLVDISAAYNASTNPAVGAFLHRSSDGSGTFSPTGVELRWNYGENGLTKVEYAEVEEIRVFAIEMVYVPQGSFFLGSGGSVGTPNDYGGSTREAGAFKAGGTTNTPYQVTSENAITIANTSGNLYGTILGGTTALKNATILTDGETSATLHAGFPKGFKAFYCMKHELNQQAYVDFLNTCSRAQQTHLIESIVNKPGYNVYVMADASSPTIFNGIRTYSTLPATGSLTFFCDMNANGEAGDSDDGAAKPANYIATRFMLAYLDWAGLRPMTELEYEKACRGTASPVALEFAWGAASGQVTSNELALSNANTDNELPNASSNVAFNGFTSIRNHVRTGGFARASSNRTTSGATYYGILEMSGNMYESVITVTREAGRNFDGKYHGDGILKDLTTNRKNSDVNEGDELYNQTTWPDVFGFGLGGRGGSVMTQRNIIRVSDRFTTLNSITGELASVRGVRTAQ